MNVHKGIHLAVPFLISLVLFLLPPQDVKEDQEKDIPALSSQLDEILADQKLDGALAGVSVRLAETGEVIYEKNASLRLKPASNMKLLTGAAALETLGADYIFATEVWTDGVMKGQKLHGDLYLKGKGDPTLQVEDLNKIAERLKNQGILEVTGNLIADDTWYDDERLSEDLTWKDETYWYGAQISALTVSPNKDYDPGTVIVAVYPTNEGEPARIEVIPDTDYVEIINHSETINAEGEEDIILTRKHGTNEIVVEGTIPIESRRFREWVSVSEPTGLALSLFHDSLIEQGIKVNGGKVGNRRVPDTAERLISYNSMPLQDLFIPFMKLSNNGHAEGLVKEMGKVVYGEGSWEKGLEVVEDYLRGTGINTKTLFLRDGSGISHVTMVPAHEISELLFQIQNKAWFHTYINSLPVAGEKERLTGGTLRLRMHETAAEGNVQAKTGSLTGVSSLSGFVTTKDGVRLIFSIILNNYLDEDIKDIEDQIAVTLAEHRYGKGDK
ncbi:D-alanyl-D-alanine carboxypeptidase/D-alanyl-D-alanine-endopeptidase [Halobacillus litoralis]|uniref:D-alanyl-D-alanine carboxypeptidase/D-alanyl-D-alanine endopeptidase n=1 Tax=Halobacillus litoralis TaxID=45668 RepID=UPI001CFE401B|nr:D-alanyl-D-alanine carboxypeptidase/D-alanyl-D-alanine-endopeptidase [Halobacillus litoralis]